MESVEALNKCPECGTSLKPVVKLNKPRLLVFILIGSALGLGMGFWFVSWWFEGSGFKHDMAIIHEMAGAILGGLTGWGIGALVARR